MLELHKKIILDENQKPIAVQIPIEEFERMEEVIENYGLAKMMDEVADDEQLSVHEAKHLYHSMKQNVEG
jgi:PHD/YefM family antitoxin component YafN of YafNO toxin-antitoxin module